MKSLNEVVQARTNMREARRGDNSGVEDRRGHCDAEARFPRTCSPSPTDVVIPDIAVRLWYVLRA
jgi:hypothetical protein